MNLSKILESLTFYGNNIFKRKSNGETAIQTVVEHDGGDRARTAQASLEMMRARLTSRFFNLVTSAEFWCSELEKHKDEPSVRNFKQAYGRLDGYVLALQEIDGGDFTSSLVGERVEEFVKRSQALEQKFNNMEARGEG
jgi:hypothetical protein